MADDSSADVSAPATKQDIHILMSEIGRLYDANARWKDEIILHFDTTAETIRHDLLGAKHDDIEIMKDRMTRLEQHTGLIGTNR